MSKRAESIQADIRALSQHKAELVKLLLSKERRESSRIRKGPRPSQEGYLTAPMSWSQQRLWFIDQLEGAGAAYFIPTTFRLHGELHLEALRRALNALARRHDVLRTTFMSAQGQPQQKIHPETDIPLQLIDLTAAPAEERERAVQDLRKEEGEKRFDLSCGPLVRATLLRLHDQEHVLQITMHHIISDGWSMGVAIRELSELYNAFRLDRPDPLPELPIQYSDYVRWQREWLQGPRYEKQLTYWRERLGGAAPHLDLPTDRARPPIQRYRGANLPIRLDAALSASLRRLAGQHHMTLFMVLYAGFAMLLSRISAQHDIVIGTPIANRQRPELEGLIGFFVNTLALRIEVRPETVLADFLGQVKAATLEAYRHQDIPFEKVVEALQPQRSLSHHPIFQTMLVLQNAPQSELRLHGISSTLEAELDEPAMFDLLMSLEDSGAEIAGLVNFATDLFDRGTLKRWMDCFTSLLRAMVDNSQARLIDLPILDESGRTQVVERFNATQSVYPQDNLVHELFEAQADRTPEAIAVVHDGHRLTYAELNRRANRLARHLRSQGVEPHDLVGICVERSVDMLVGLLAILKIGAAYVPLDPHYPPERLQHMVSDSSPCIVLTQSRLATQSAFSGTRIVALDTDANVIALFGGGNLPAADLGLDATDRVYVIYTSGSTGIPKGTAMSHRSMINLIEWHGTQFGPTEGTRVLQYAALSFDVAFQETFTTLGGGGTLFLLDEWVRRDPPALIDFLRSRAIQRLFIPPLMLQALAEHVGHTHAVPHALQEVITAGEQLRISPEIRSLFAHLPGCRLHNHYGPTETHVVTALTLSGDPQRWPDTPAIGYPIANTRIYILDSERRPVPIGVPGEIYIGGACVALGYLNRPDLTQARFITDPVTGRPGEPVYKTGDVGRWEPDGRIRYLGRNDHQVKLRGFRIELGEIEWRLTRHPQVAEAVVIVREETAGNGRLVAYVTLRGQAAPSLESLRAHLKAALPEHMLPAAIVILEKLPQTPGGKLDRQALPVPEPQAYASRQYEPPRGEIEQTLAAVWCELLRVDPISRADHFFELGGHSLLVVQMLERLRAKGLTTRVRCVFENPVLADLARLLRRDGEQDHDLPAHLIPAGCETITPEMVPLAQLRPADIEHITRYVPGGASNIQDIYPLAPLQEGLLFHYQLDPSGDIYVLPALFCLQSQNKVDDFIAAIQQVMDRHDVLRTAVVWENLPQPLQIVCRRASLPVHTLTPDPHRDPVELLQQFTRPEYQRLDLRRAPLMRLLLAPAPQSSEWFGLLQLHHLICDNRSLHILLTEIVACVEGRGEELPAPIPYRNHVAQTLARLRADDAEAFFRRKLGTVEETSAPFGLTDVLGDASQIDQACETLDNPLAGQLRLLASHLGVSTATIFHAAWALLVAQTSGRDEVVFGTVLLGRLQGNTDAQRAIGMFINTLPLCLRLTGSTAKELIYQTHRELAELFEHEQASLAQAQRCSGIKAPAPLFTSLLNYRHGNTDHSSNLHTTLGIRLVPSGGGTNYPITMAVDDSGKSFELTADTDRRVSALRVLSYFRTALKSLLEALDNAAQRPILALPIVPETEQYQLLETFNPTDMTPRTELLHEIFEQQVRRTPDTPAVVHGQQSVTYAELNARANRLARYLRSRGIGPEQLIGICMERGLEMMISILAVWKAGAAYVPLDPRHPAARLQQVLEDCEPSLLLTQQSLRSVFQHPALPILFIEDSSAELAAQTSDDLEMRTSGSVANNLAYVIFTSGSTGRPKGVMVEHRNVVSHWQALQSLYRKPFDCRRIGVNASFTFDASVQQFVQLLSGCTLHIIPTALRLDPHALLSFIGENRIEGLDCTPTQLATWIEAGLLEKNRCKPRTILVGGEAIKPQLWTRLSQCSEMTFHNVYGPTECTVDSTSATVKESAERPHVGRPMRNTQIFILGAQHQPVPIGVVGEVYIGGAGVARGYLRSPELTEERFVAVTLLGRTQRLFRSGDRGRWKPDGTIELLGREDDQVKIRGHRIELGEIEAQLTKHHRVKEAVVLAREDIADDLRLVAYVTRKPESASEEPPFSFAHELQVQLQSVLPDYMVPASLVVLERFPLTPSGKLDRRALPAPARDSCTHVEYEPPRGQTEESLARIWQTLLHLERVGRKDNFFELGGHSLHALRVNNAIADLFQVEIGVAAVFRHPTILQMAAHIESAQTSARSREPQEDEFEEGTL